MSTAPIHPVIRSRGVIVALFILLCAWLLPGLADLREDDDVLAFLPPEHPDVVAFHEVADRFGMLELVLVGLEVEQGRGDLFDPERVEQIRRLADELRGLEGIRLVITFADLPHPQVNAEGLEVAPLVPTAMEDAAQIRQRVLESPDAPGNLITSEGDAAALLVYLVPARGAERTERRGRVLEQMRQVVRTGWDGPAHLGGAVVMEEEGAGASRGDVRRLSPIVIGVLVLASAALLGSGVAALLNLVVAGAGVGLVMGALGWLNEPLSIVSSTTPVMVVALGGAFGVHILSGYRRNRGTSPQRASAVVRELWAPVTLSGVTTALSFFVLLVMPQVPMQRFGVMAGCGVLLLVVLALFLLPALLSMLPSGWLPPREESMVRITARPPAWLLTVLAISGAAAATTLRAEPDTTAVFDPDSAPRRADAFFAREFGGSTFLQIAVEADLREPAVLRRIRELQERVATFPGVVDVRSVVEPVAILNAALGGRRGIPESPGRAARVMTYLVGHPAMAQLMTDHADAALVHVRLSPMDGQAQVGLTQEVEALVAELFPTPGLHVVDADRVADRRREAVRVRLGRLLGREIEGSALASRAEGGSPAPALLEEVRRLRDRALDSDDSPVEGVPRQEIDGIDAAELITPRGRDLEAMLRARLPTLVATDPEGIRYVAEHLGSWLDEAITRDRGRARCDALGVTPPRCDELAPVLSELEDAEWTASEPGEGPGARTVATRARVTGQPVIGRAFAEAVTRSLSEATAVSAAALGLVLGVTGFAVALVPALWTLCVTAGIVALLGHPISVGTTMVACIALGTGVDFAIHLLVRARRLGGPDAGRRAVDGLGSVTVVAAGQLGVAFCVLALSVMPPLRQFGIGLAIGLVGAALGAIWTVPGLWRLRFKSLK